MDLLTLLALLVGVWKLPMRNPSTRTAKSPRRAATGLEATYEESKQLDQILGRVVRRGLEATYEESKPTSPGRRIPRPSGFGSYL